MVTVRVKTQYQMDSRELSFTDILRKHTMVVVWDAATCSCCLGEGMMFVDTTGVFPFQFEAENQEIQCLFIRVYQEDVGYLGNLAEKTNTA